MEGFPSVAAVAAAVPLASFFLAYLTFLRGRKLHLSIQSADDGHWHVVGPTRFHGHDGVDYHVLVIHGVLENHGAVLAKAVTILTPERRELDGRLASQAFNAWFSDVTRSGSIQACVDWGLLEVREDGTAFLRENLGSHASIAAGASKHFTLMHVSPVSASPWMGPTLNSAQEHPFSLNADWTRCADDNGQEQIHPIHVLAKTDTGVGLIWGPDLLCDEPIGKVWKFIPQNRWNYLRRKDLRRAAQATATNAGGAQSRAAA